jgi:NAD(P)-dependent dehydrogenase (short-subunit alcohol dehydrogenase family)
MNAFVESTPDYPNLLRLDGKHVIVLGGGLGIGRQTSIAAASVGAHVSVVDSDPDRAKSVAAEVDGLALTGDITDRADLQRVMDSAVERFGPLHGLADIVGISDFGPLADATDEAFQRGIDLNLKHVFLALQIGSRAMTSGGSMAFVASASGFRSAPNHGIYGAAKAGLMNMLGTAALELGPAIRVNAIAPGQTATPRIVARHPQPEYFDGQALQVPLGRVGQPADIASGLLFFLSDLSQWVTGQTLVVDGGAGRKYQYTVLLTTG